MTCACRSLGTAQKLPLSLNLVHPSPIFIHFPFAFLIFKIVHVRVALEIRDMSHHDLNVLALGWRDGSVVKNSRGSHRVWFPSPTSGSLQPV